MKDRILFWWDAGLIHFGIAKFLQEIHDAEYYAIVDTNKGKEFFENQKLVNLEKIWFHRDSIILNKKPNIKFLKSIEKKYGINLWQIIYSDQFFNQYNKYYKFKQSEIVSIVEQEIIFYEKVLEDVKPNFLIIRPTDYSKNQILHQICKAKNIPILTVGQNRLGSNVMITTENDLLEDYEKVNNLEKNMKKYTWEEMNLLLKTYSKNDADFFEEYQSSIIKKILATVYYITQVRDSNYKNYYEHNGRTLFNILKNEIKFYFEKWKNEKFLENNSVKKIPLNHKYVYFPLQFEPERSILIAAPFYSNQLEVVKNIAKALPVDYFLYVKEHPVQSIRGWRNKNYYRQIIELPNVKFIHHSISSENLIKNASLIATITGTAGLQASLMQKPSIVFAKTVYSDLPSVFRVKNMEELPEIISKALKEKVKLTEVNNGINEIKQNSFEFNLANLESKINDNFYYGSYLQDVEIDENKMKDCLKQNEVGFKLLANEHKKRIKFYTKDKNANS